MFKKIHLKPGKEKPLLNYHHWIFSGAIQHFPDLKPGEIAEVISSSDQTLGFAYFNKKSSIIGRMIAFGVGSPLHKIEEAVKAAIDLRKSIFDEKTTAYRLINGEGDCLPGLIVDKYADTLVVQISTAGMEELKSFIIDLLDKILCPAAILEKSLSPSRKEEGLLPLQKVLKGIVNNQVLILENGIKFFVDPINGQKTGFFLDQREMRSWVLENSFQKRVLNCFSYTGGFSVYALAGGAKTAMSVDISETALIEAKKNCQINGFEGEFHTADAFKFLHEDPLNYDLIILDPPAFAKRAKDITAACRGYKEINRVTLKKMPAKSILVTCSCSYFVDEKLFQQVIFQAASEAKRNVRIIGKHRQAQDHPVNLFHPEGSYLKSLVLFVD